MFDRGIEEFDDAARIEAAEKYGMEYVVLGEEDVQKVREAQLKTYETWLTDTESLGLPAKKIGDRFYELYDQNVIPGYFDKVRAAN